MRITTYRTSPELRDQMTMAMIREGVSLRRKSRWLCEAIQSLFEADPGLAGVGAGEDLETFDVVETLQIDETTDAIIERAYEILRGPEPRLDGVQSSVVRAAIRLVVGRKDVAA